MLTKIIQKLEKLNKLNEQAHNPKILWEEMKIVSDTSFKLQEEILELVKEAEKEEKDIAVLQQLFETREIVWDIINSIAEQELFIKEKTHTKHKKCCTKSNKNHSHDECDCDDGCCCKHKH